MITRSNPDDHPAPNAQVQLLRSRVEDDLKKPAVVMVTSARQGDGKSMTAETLALGLKTQGHRTALVRLSALRAEGGEGWEFLDCGNDGATIIAELPRYEDGVTTPESLAVFVDRMRTDYDYTVVDADAFLSSTPTMTLSRIVDGIVLAIRLGRRPCDDDKSMLKMIEHSRGRVVGVVAIEAEASGKSGRRKTEQRTSLPPKEAAGLTNGSRKSAERASRPTEEVAGLANVTRKSEEHASSPGIEAAGSANGKPYVRTWNLSRLFRPDH